jgi:DNA-directed RNA polymerase specialized sigma24 family protein
VIDEDSDLLVRLASRDEAALADLYDRHARSVYGYALAITRRPREARRALIRTFEALARGPDSASTAGSLRRHLLSLARPIAWAERSRWRLRLPAHPRAYALDPEASSPDLIEEANQSADNGAEDTLLRAVEGFDPDAEEVAPGTTTRGAWRPPPPSMRALTLSRAREASRPARRYARWLLSWALFAAALLTAVGSDVASPRLPEVSYTPPAGRMGEPLKEELRVRRHLHWILEGFRREER